MMDVENYIETQSKILTSETLALQTIRNTALGADASSEAFATGSLANQKRPSELGAFLGSLSARRVPNSRLMDVSFEATSPLMAARSSTPTSRTSSTRSPQPLSPPPRPRLGSPINLISSRVR